MNNVSNPTSITNNATSIYELYAYVDAQIAELNARKEQLRSQITQTMIEQGLNKADTSVGKFSLSPKKTWTYPEAVSVFEKATKEEVSVLIEAVKEAKAKAESTGEATFTEVETLRFTSVKL